MCYPMLLFSIHKGQKRKKKKDLPNWQPCSCIYTAQLLTASRETSNFSQGMLTSGTWCEQARDIIPRTHWNASTCYLSGCRLNEQPGCHRSSWNNGSSCWNPAGMNPFYFTGFYLFKTKHSNFLITWLFLQELGHQMTLIRNVAKKVFSEMDVTLSYKVGTMIEIPRAALVADEVC